MQKAGRPRRRSFGKDAAAALPAGKRSNLRWPPIRSSPMQRRIAVPNGLHPCPHWRHPYAGRDWQSGMYIRSGTISAKHFYDLQKAGNYASASQITPIQYFQSFEPALSAETTFVSVFSSGMSGTFQSAQVCAEELREDAFLQKGVLSFIL